MGDWPRDAVKRFLPTRQPPIYMVTGPKPAHEIGLRVEEEPWAWDVENVEIRRERNV